MYKFRNPSDILNSSSGQQILQQNHNRCVLKYYFAKQSCVKLCVCSPGRYPLIVMKTDDQTLIKATDKFCFESHELLILCDGGACRHPSDPKQDAAFHFCFHFSFQSGVIVFCGKGKRLILEVFIWFIRIPNFALKFALKQFTDSCLAITFVQLPSSAADGSTVIAIILT